MSESEIKTENLLAERSTTHGDYTDNARVAQEILEVCQSGRNWPTLPRTMRESLHMIAHKMARILGGDPYVADHWDDIAGYAKLVPPRIEDMLRDLSGQHDDVTTRIVRTSDQMVLTSEENQLILQRRAGEKVDLYEDLAKKWGVTRTVAKSRAFQMLYGLPFEAQLTMAIETSKTAAPVYEGGDSVYVKGDSRQAKVTTPPGSPEYGANFMSVSYLDNEPVTVHVSTVVHARNTVPVEEPEALADGTEVEFDYAAGSTMHGRIRRGYVSSIGYMYEIEYQQHVGTRRIVHRPYTHVRLRSGASPAAAAGVPATTVAGGSQAPVDSPDGPDYSLAVDISRRYRHTLTHHEYENVGYAIITEGSEKGRTVRSLYEVVTGGAAPDHYARMRANKIEEYGL